MESKRTIKKVALTGGIGSGKSTVCRLFALLGIPVYNSDKRAKELMSEDETIRHAIVELLGEEAYEGKTPNKGYIALQVFNNSDKLAALNAIVHPAVMRDFEQWATLHGKSVSYVMMESAIVFDAGLDKYFDKTITVSAPEKMRVKRVAKRDGTTVQQISARIAAQMSDAERESKADFTITNDEKSLVWEQVLAIDKSLHTLN